MPFIAESHPLHSAVIANDSNKVTHVLHSGFPPGHMLIDKLDDNGLTPLHCAAEYGHEEIALLLISEGAKVNAINTARVTPLHMAAANGQRKMVELLIANGATIDVDSQQGTALHNAVKNGHKEVAEMLMERGAKVNVNESHGFAPLDLAVINGRAEIVSLLLEKGADLAHRKFSRTALHFAVEYGHKEIAEVLLQRAAAEHVDMAGPIPPLSIAAEKGRLGIVEMLVANGQEVNAPLSNGNTSLHLAAEKGHNDIVTFLVNNGADVNARNKKGKTPLFYAYKNGLQQTVDLLLSHGAEKWEGFDSRQMPEARVCGKCGSVVRRGALSCSKCKTRLIPQSAVVVACLTGVSCAVLVAWIMFVNAAAIASFAGSRGIMILILACTVIAGLVGGFFSALLSRLIDWKLAAVPMVALLGGAGYVLSTQETAWQALGYLAITCVVLIVAGFVFGKMRR